MTGHWTVWRGKTLRFPDGSGFPPPITNSTKYVDLGRVEGVDGPGPYKEPGYWKTWLAITCGLSRERDSQTFILCVYHNDVLLTVNCAFVSFHYSSLWLCLYSLFSLFNLLSVPTSSLFSVGLFNMCPGDYSTIYYCRWKYGGDLLLTDQEVPGSHVRRYLLWRTT